MTRTEQFTINFRWDWKAGLSVEIECEASASYGVKLGLAVKAALKGGANLYGANLCGADLREANLREANLCEADLREANLCEANLREANLCEADLREANLCGANLYGADLCEADLRAFKADMWMTLTSAGATHVLELIARLRAGEIDGSTYGEVRGCACLVGTLEQSGAEDLPRNSDNPAEQWFMMIKPGDKPADDTGGGFAAKMALEWALDWCRASGVDVTGEAA